MRWLQNYAAMGGAAGEPSRLIQIDTTESGVLLAITSATALAFFAMVGFEDSVNMAEEVSSRPGSSRPRCCSGWAPPG